MAIGLPEAILFATIFGSILFGLYTALFGSVLYLLGIKNQDSGRFLKPIFLVSVAMYVVAFAHIVLAIIRTVIGFIDDGGSQSGPNDYFFKTGGPLYLAKTGLYILQTLIGDSFIIYRMSVTWNGDKRLVLPMIACLLGSLACGVGSLHADATVGMTKSVFTVKSWIASFFSLTLVTNVICTGLIAMKIWWVHRAAAEYLENSGVFNAMEIVLESGLVYSAALFSLLGAFLSSSWAQYIVLDMVVQIIGIVFSAIIVRLRLGTSHSQRSTLVSSLHAHGGLSKANNRSRSRFPSTLHSQGILSSLSGEGGEDEGLPMKSLAIKVNRSYAAHDDQGYVVSMPTRQEYDLESAVGTGKRSGEINV